MLRRQRLRRAYLLGSLLLLATSLHAPTAYAAPGDPPSGSPAGAVYQLPLQKGRADAAPKGGGGTGVATDEGGAGGGAGSGGGGGGAGTGAPESLYRSENNFGSSSHVPGAAGGAAGSGGGAGTGAAGGGGSAAAGAAIAGGVAAAETADTGNTSVAAGLALLGGITLLGVAVGLLSRRFGTSPPS